jgi:hypothetical protein
MSRSAIGYLMCMGHALNWTPGSHGKGIVTPEGEAHTWNVDRQDGMPNHQEYLERVFGARDTNPYTEYNAFEIGPEGRVYEGPSDIDKLDPRLVPTDKWNFQSRAQHRLNWRPGEYGKGLIHDGAVHTWGVGANQDGWPTHPEYAEETLGLERDENGEHPVLDTAFGIHHEGVLNVYDDNGWSSHPENEGRVATEAMAADPRLRVPSSDKPVTWNFLGVAKNDGKWQLVKMGMPVDEGFWQRYPGELYHGTTPARLESIMQHGLQPWDSDVAGGTNYGKPNPNEVGKTTPDGWLIPRPGHVYMAQHPMDARDRAIDDVNRRAVPPEEPIVLRIDPSHLDPHHINPDEDNMIPEATINPQRGYDSLGQMAEAMGYGDLSGETERQITHGNHIGYRGTIPPEALQPGVMRSGAWEPIEWPHTASLIGDMRDGWGRFAVTAPWSPGQWGKGIYYPETGVLQTWADDRTHLDVWGDDENYSQPGSAHHIVIRPNGTVRDQGAFDRDFGDAQSDIEGLQRALQELDPSLRLDTSNSWSFGPTEPMEEEPSSVSRGEDGGSVHGVQTGTDYAGSL